MEREGASHSERGEESVEACWREPWEQGQVNAGAERWGTVNQWMQRARTGQAEGWRAHDYRQQGHVRAPQVCLPAR
jgi:hypothetical protein